MTHLSTCPPARHPRPRPGYGAHLPCTCERTSNKEHCSACLLPHSSTLLRMPGSTCHPDPTHVPQSLPLGCTPAPLPAAGPPFSEPEGPLPGQGRPGRQMRSLRRMTHATSPVAHSGNLLDDTPCVATFRPLPQSLTWLLVVPRCFLPKKLLPPESVSGSASGHPTHTKISSCSLCC